MRSLPFILAFALAGAALSAATGAFAAPLILEVQEQPQKPAEPPVQEKSQNPAGAPAPAPQQTPAQAPDAAPVSPQAQAPAPVSPAPPEPPKQQAAQPAPAPAASTPPAESPKKQAADPAPAPAPTASAPAPLAPPPAREQAAVAPARFSFQRIDGGLLRLDSANGQVAICKSHDAGWACEAVPEERAALEKEISRLQGEVAGLNEKVARLQQDIAKLREPPPTPRPPADLAPRSDDHSGFKMPSDEDMARARAAIVDAWERLMDMIGKLQRDMTRKTAPPDRTTL